MINTPAVIFDIDGTLADMDYRKHLVMGKEKDWKKFYEQSLNDETILCTEKLLKSFIEGGYIILYCTGRRENNRKVTEKWLKKKGIFPGNSLLLMRKKGDERDRTEVKRDIFRLLNKVFNVVLAVENDEETSEMYTEEGVLCLLCGDIIKKGDYRDDKYTI